MLSLSVSLQFPSACGHESKPQRKSSHSKKATGTAHSLTQVLACSCSMWKQAREHGESSHKVWELYCLPTSEVCAPVLCTYSCRMHCSSHILNVPLLHDNLNKMSSLALMFWVSSHTICLPESCKYVLTFQTSQPRPDTRKLYKTYSLGLHAATENCGDVKTQLER